jgi:hypothetical protein
VGVMTDAIEQRRRELFVAEHLDPFGERQIGGDDGRAPFITLSQQIEEQLASSISFGRDTPLSAAQSSWSKVLTSAKRASRSRRRAVL